MTGNVFDIQRYSIHDGQGIRTVVFLKGCPLRCKWCSNPESWKAEPQLFYVRSRCIDCKTCVAVCQNREVEENGSSIKINWENCKGDYGWVEECPTGALCVKGRRMSAEEVMEEIRRDRIFYEYSGGGVTFSGGEPLLQEEFVLELLKTCREEGISTAVETSGSVSEETLRRVLPFVDLFLYDLKMMNSVKHKEWTGQDNKRILKNLKMLAEEGADITVRTPMIPGVNDSEEELLDIMEYLRACGIQKYSILPFHQYGSGKYESIGIPYELAWLGVHRGEAMNKRKAFISEQGFLEVS